MTLETFPSLAGVPGLLHGITTRAVPRAHAAAALGVDRPVVSCHQIHGARIVERDEGSSDAPGEADGLATDTAGGPLLAVLGADCPGVLLVAPGARALAVLHAGWRGVVAGIVPEGVRRMQARYGVRPEDLRVGIGPGIGGARYEVSTEVGERIARAAGVGAREDVLRPGRPGHAYADLRAAIRAQLAAAGVPAAQVETHPSCTYDDARFFSVRREGPDTGRHLLLAAWR